MEAEVRRAPWWLVVLVVMSWSAALGGVSGARAEGTEQGSEGLGSVPSESQHAETASAFPVAATASARESFRSGSDESLFGTGDPPEAENRSEGTPEPPDVADSPAATAVAARSLAEDRSEQMGDDRTLVPSDDPQESEDYDPWESFNMRTFEFNRQVDHYAIKPMATAWETVMPEPVRDALGRMFDNLMMPKRFVNNLLQGKFEGACRELTRFVFNSVFGLAGLFDVGKRDGVEPSIADTGQTLAKYGAGPGPYLVLPFLPPLTVRDAIGYGIDAALNPLTYVAPFAATVSLKASDAVNERSYNLEAFENVEAGSLDLYGAVRNGYLTRREKAVRE